MGKYNYNMRKQKVTNLGQAIDEWIAENKSKKKLDETSIINNWSDFVGEHMSKSTKGLRIVNGILFVKITSGIVKQELQIIRTPLKNKINKKYGFEILKDIRLDL